MTELSSRERFQKLLNQTNFSSDHFASELDGIELDRLQVNQEKSLWTFIFSSPTIVPAKLYWQLYVSTKKSFSHLIDNIEFQFVVDNSLDEDGSQITNYWKIFIEKNKDLDSRLTADAKTCQLAADAGQLTILATNQLVADNLNNSINTIQSAFDNFGFRAIDIKIEVDQSLNQQLVEKFEKKEQEIDLIQNTNLTANKKAISDILIGKNFNGTPVTIDSIIDPDTVVNVQGQIFEIESRDLKNNKVLLQIKITDYTSSIIAKAFLDENQKSLVDNLQKNQWVKVHGRVEEDRYARDLTITIFDLVKVTHESREDTAKDKRVELHVHTKMSTMDGISSPEDYINLAKKWQHRALAITDNASVQAFPDAAKLSDDNFKIIYGMEANLVEDGAPVVINIAGRELDDQTTYVAFDIETTGLSAVYDEVIELSAVKMQNDKVIDTFSQFINPGFKLSYETIELTSITDEMLTDALDKQQVFEKFREFYGDAILIGHNVTFDLGFMNTGYQRMNLPTISNPVIDTLVMSRWLNPSYKVHTLNVLAKKFGIALEQHHRAIYDSETTGHLAFIFLKMANQQYQITNLNQLNDHVSESDYWKHSRINHISVLVKNQLGLKNLFKLVSTSSTRYFNKTARVPRSILPKYREGLLIGSGDHQSELFETMVQKGYEEAKNLAGFYDYFEIQPIDNYLPLIESQFIADKKQLQTVIENFVKLSQETNKPLVVTGNVHYLDPEDQIYRKILVSGLPASRENKYSFAAQHLKSTDEILNQFDFLDEKIAKEIVIDNTVAIADAIENVQPLKDELYTPTIEGADQQIQDLSYHKAEELYGNPLPDLIQQRLDRELRSIVGNGFSVIYLISQKLVSKSNKDGYLVGSRGSVGSSLVATLLGITEVNPMAPHYRSKYGDYFELVENYQSGYDLPEKEDPNHPGEYLIGDGQNIPFETFLGFKGNKVPDIDLNFSGDYQQVAHTYTKALFGEENVYRAGTISTVASKTAFGFVKGYERDHNLQFKNAELDRLSIGATGVKRTTGQHPGGVLIVPENMEIFDFTPYQFPADDQNSLWKTTHFDYHAIHDNILKMDLLGHDDPTMLRALQDLTGIDPTTIPTNDRGVMSIFQSTKILGVDSQQINSTTGTLGIPEFGTNFVRRMLEDTNPSNYSELLQISGLSHGTNVWRDNADQLIKDKKATIATVIGTRDKIMTDLINWGIEPETSFQIMESVRKGKGVDEQQQAVMREHNVPEWYIQSAQKIQYMFPRAHAAAYVLMALRIAYFKVYFKMAYYAAYFSVRNDQIDIVSMSQGKVSVKNQIKRLKALGKEATAKDANLLSILEIANEALERDVVFKMVDLDRSSATEWVIDGNDLIAPFMSLPSLGETVAKQIVAARAEKDFLSKEDLQKRGNVNKTLLDFMDDQGILRKLPDQNQLSLFEDFNFG